MHNEGGFMMDNQSNKIQQGRKTEGGRKVDTMTPLLIKWVHHVLKESEDDIYKIDGIVLDKVKLVGSVGSFNNQGTKTAFILDDGTGSIELTCNKKFDQEISPIVSHIDFTKFTKKRNCLSSCNC